MIDAVKPKQSILGLDTVIFWLVTSSALVNWEKLFSLSTMMQGRLMAWSRMPVINRFLPVDAGILFDPLRWMMVTIIVACLITYTIIDYLAQDRSSHLAYRFKASLVVLVVLMLVFLPTAKEIVARQQVGTWTHANDNVMQTERSIELLLEGKDFYHEDYLDSDLMRFQDSYKNPGEHPTLYHFIYMPSDTVISVPGYLVIKKVLGWYDQRFLYLLLFALSMWLVVKIAPRGESGLAVLSAYALNPFTVPFIIEGRNDIFTLFWILTALYLYRSKKPGPAWVSLAIGCAHKQFAWFLLPFFFIYAAKPTGFGRNELLKALREHKSGLLVFVLVFSVFILPFLIWHPADFIDDILGFGMGFSKTSMPIEGASSFGFGTVVLYRGWVDSINERFPFWLFQVLIVLPLLYLTLRRQVRENTMAAALVGSSLVLIVFTFFSRFLHDNHIGYATSLLIVAYFAKDDEDTTMSTSSPPS